PQRFPPSASPIRVQESCFQGTSNRQARLADRCTAEQRRPTGGPKSPERQRSAGHRQCTKWRSSHTPCLTLAGGVLWPTSRVGGCDRSSLQLPPIILRRSPQWF